MRRRRGESAPTAKGAALLSLHSSGDDLDDHEEKSAKLAADALRSMERCCKTCFVAVFADVIVTIVDGDMWSKFLGTNEATLSWVDVFDIIDGLGLFLFGLGLWRITRSLKRAATCKEGKRGRISDEDFLGMMRTMAVMWGMSALNFAFVSVSMAAALPSHSQGGPFHFMEGVSSSKASSIAGTTLGIGTLGTCLYCRKTAYEEDVKDNRRITLHQQKSKANVTFTSSRQVAYRAYRNQACCVTTFGFNATLELLRWAVDAKSGIVGRVLSASDVAGPFAIVLALVGMNRCFLRAAIARLRIDGSGRGDAGIFQDLFAAQTKFYGMIHASMKDATLYRLLPFLVRPFQPQIMSALDRIAQALSVKIADLSGN